MDYFLIIIPLSVYGTCRVVGWGCKKAMEWSGYNAAVADLQKLQDTLKGLNLKV